MGEPQRAWNQRQDAKRKTARELNRRYYEKIEITPVLDNDGKFKGWYTEFDFLPEQWAEVEAASARHDMTGEAMLKLLAEIALHSRPAHTFSRN